MFILLLLLCAAASASAASPNIPPINGQDRSGFFNFMKQEFESRRMHINIVDTVSSNSSSAEHASSPTVSIGLLPSDKYPQQYGFLSRKVAEALGCIDATNAAFESDGNEPEYVLTVTHDNTQAIYRDEESSAEGDEMLRRIALQAGMSREEASKVELVDCWFMRSPEVMRLNIAMREAPKIKSGWIVERYPLGRFYQNPTISYRYPVYITNHSYIDGTSGSIIDVHESKDENGKRVWTPSSWPAFARVAIKQDDLKNLPEFTLFRETETGVLITTLCPNMSLSYNINDETYEEQLATDGHHFHVTCDRLQGTRSMYIEVRGFPHSSNTTTNDGMTITLSSPNRSHSFRCRPKRATPTGIPELVQLDFVETKGSDSILPAERNLVITKIDWVRRDEDGMPLPPSIDPEAKELPYSEEQLPLARRPSVETEWPENISGEFEMNPAATDDEQDDYDRTRMLEKAREDWNREDQESEEFLIYLAVSLVAVVIFALITVVMMVACTRRCIRSSRKSVAQAKCSDRDGTERRRKDGCRLLAPALTQPTETSNEKCAAEPEEQENEKPSSTPVPTRSNSGKKKLTFAPRNATMKTEELVKMISDAEIGQRIDAMVEAGPDGEEAQQEPKKYSSTSAPIALSEVVDETSEVTSEASESSSETSGNNTDQTPLID